MQFDFEELEAVETGCWKCRRQDQSLCRVQRFSDESEAGFRLASDRIQVENEYLAKIEEVVRKGNDTELRTKWYGHTLRWHLGSDPHFSQLAALNALACGLKGIAALHSYGLIHGCIQPSSLWVDVSGNGVLAGFWSTSEQSSSASLFQDKNSLEEPAGDIYALGKVANWILVKIEISEEERGLEYFERALTEFESIACSEDPRNRDIRALWRLLRDAIHREMLREEAVFYADKFPNRSQLYLTLRQHYESAAQPSSSLDHTHAYDYSLHFLKSATVYQSQKLYDLADYCYTCCLLASNFLKIEAHAKKVCKIAQDNRDEMRSRVDAQLGLA